ncbi:Actin-related protein 10 [Vanrija pseudolonga]|uniref:Actin-related protein 10 n=1 Tax=Vanrija pseudolonga TaxID=143232 RepID=A0AAF0Y338_9TREE|nr:Actin-related protein 10 [Vanrija pseudolonga]
MASSTGGQASTTSAVSTPVKRSSASGDAGPSRRPTGHHSPAYRRHSYGAEDRVVIDPGSRVWKVGISGEADPRAVFWATDEGDRAGAAEAWDLDLSAVAGARGNRTEARRMVAARIERRLREAFHKHLLVDAKARKVVIVENTFLPTYVKEEIASALFDNLKSPSVSFTPATLLTLGACGRITGLVVDIGWLETTVFCSRPLNHLARSSPIAGRALHSRLRALVRHYGKYYPAPPASRSPAPPNRTPVTPVPLGVLTDRVVERVLTEACFAAPEAAAGTSSAAPPGGSSDMFEPLPEIDDAGLMQTLHDRYAGAAGPTKDWTLTIPSARGVGPCSYLVVPGWVRARAADILFGDGPAEDESVTEQVISTLLKLPVDLRAELASSIVVSGGIASLPGIVPRLRDDILHHISQAPAPLGPDTTATTAAWRSRASNPKTALHGLESKLAILNDPSPLDGRASTKGGTAPRWSPSLLAWVGGSLAGAIKAVAPELIREDYDQLMSDQVERSEVYHTALEEERKGIPAPSVGLDLDELRPGMATMALVDRRKRGWAPGGVVPDWTTTGLRASV